MVFLMLVLEGNLNGVLFVLFLYYRFGSIVKEEDLLHFAELLTPSW